MLLRQKDHADAIFAGGRQRHALLRHHFAVKAVGNLQQNTGAVAHQRVGAHRAAVIQVFEDLQPLLHDVMAAHALDMGDETDAASVMLVLRMVQALRLRHGGQGFRPGGRRHRARLLFLFHEYTVCLVGAAGSGPGKAGEPQASASARMARRTTAETGIYAMRQ